MCFFFFFQAEDGIRDYKVTGVQTCALPISRSCCLRAMVATSGGLQMTRRSYGLQTHDLVPDRRRAERRQLGRSRVDRKSTRLNSSHLVISYAVFCLKKKKKDSKY